MILLLVSCIRIFLCTEEINGWRTWAGHKIIGLEGEKEKKATAAKDMAARYLNSSCSALHMISCNGEELPQMVKTFGHY